MSYRSRSTRDMSFVAESAVSGEDGKCDWKPERDNHRIHHVAPFVLAVMVCGFWDPMDVVSRDSDNASGGKKDE